MQCPVFFRYHTHWGQFVMRPMAASPNRLTAHTKYTLPQPFHKGPWPWKKKHLFRQCAAIWKLLLENIFLKILSPIMSPRINSQCILHTELPTWFLSSLTRIRNTVKGEMWYFMAQWFTCRYQNTFLWTDWRMDKTVQCCTYCNQNQLSDMSLFLGWVNNDPGYYTQHMSITRRTSCMADKVGSEQKFCFVTFDSSPLVILQVNCLQLRPLLSISGALSVSRY